MTLTTLVDTATLADRIGDFTIVDCRYTLEDEGWGRREYLAGHIPSAAYAHLAQDLAGNRTGRNGRHPLPEVEALKQTFGRLGIAKGVQVVAYDQDTGMYASRLWWLLRWLGHESVAVLDGGFAKWVAERRPVVAGDEQHAPRRFIGTPRPGATMSADEVAEKLSRSDWRIVDARSPERYRGETEPIDRIAGHIPAAVNRFFKLNLDEPGTFRSPEELREGLREIIGGIPADHVVCYCGSGVTACHDLLALEHAGLHGAKLYPGSWSEWSSDPSRPVERDGN
jgi:thiosulfate/3-mercaptopyruvate sulfurtransferase